MASIQIARAGRTAALLLSAASAALLCTPARAAEAKDTVQLETIIVTAQRRSENEQTIPISVASKSGAELATLGITNTQGLSESTPGLNISTNVGNTFVFIRGVGTTALSVENDVGLYIDGVYVASQTGSLLNLSNIDHVEVLKGPQGTLFGRNAIGGALQVVTKDPTHTPSGEISLSYANYETATGNFYGSTGLTDNLAADLAVYVSKQSKGWGRDLTTGLPTFKAKTVQIRNKWVFTPSDTTKISASFDWGHDHNQLGANWHFLPGRLGVDGQSTYAGFYNSLADGKSQNESQKWGTMLRVDQDFGWARGVSITGYRDSRDANFIDQDATPLPAVEGGPTPQNSKTFSQEVQLLSPQSSKLQWIVGGFYMHDKYYTPGFNIRENGNATHVVFIVNEPTKSYAAFGQATAEVLDDTHLTLGARYTHDRKSVSGQTFVNDVHVTPLDAAQAKTFKKVTYRIALDHQFTPNVLGYVSYDTGFKSGQFNLISYAALPVNPEELKAWQAGVKSEFFDHRVRLNVAAFHYRFSNIQVTQVVVGGTQLLNAAAAKLYGADFDLDARLTQDLTLQSSLSLLHGRFTDFPNAPSYVPSGTGANNLVTIPNARGYHTAKSPSATAYAAADYKIPLANGGLELNGNLSYNSGYYWDPDNRLKQPAYTLLGAFAKWGPDNANWNVQVWGKNLTGKKYYSYENAFALGDIGSPAPPRTYGVTLDLRF